jgi:hypothetical protein
MNAKKVTVLRQLVRAKLQVERIEGALVGKPIKGWLINRAQRNASVVTKDGSTLSLGERIDKHEARVDPRSSRGAYISLKRGLSA